MGTGPVGFPFVPSLSTLAVFRQNPNYIDGLRKAGDAPGHKIVVAVCVCIGVWILDFGSWILDFGVWILDFGSV